MATAKEKAAIKAREKKLMEGANKRKVAAAKVKAEKALKPPKKLIGGGKRDAFLSKNEKIINEGRANFNKRRQDNIKEAARKAKEVSQEAAKKEAARKRAVAQKRKTAKAATKRNK